MFKNIWNLLCIIFTGPSLKTQYEETIVQEAAKSFVVEHIESVAKDNVYNVTDQITDAVSLPKKPRKPRKKKQ